MYLQQPFLATDWSETEQTIDLNVNYREGALLQHQFAFEIDDGTGNISIPTTGTITVTVKAPGGSIYHPVVDGTIDMTDRGEWIKRCATHSASFKFTPSGLDAGFRFRVFLESSC